MIDNESVITKRHDCMPCRLVSGFGVIGMGAYIYSQAKHRPAGIGRNIIFAVAAAACGVGTTRLLGVYPFNK